MGKNVQIKESKNEGKVIAGESNAGGIAGFAGFSNVENENYVITNFTNTGEIVTNKYCGGIVGDLENKTKIHNSNCTNSGNLICYGMSAGDIFGNV